MSSVYVDGRVLKRWKMISIPFHNLNEVPKFNHVIQVASEFPKVSAHKKLEHKSGMSLEHKSMLYQMVVLYYYFLLCSSLFILHVLLYLIEQVWTNEDTKYDVIK